MRGGEDQNVSFAVPLFGLFDLACCAELRFIIGDVSLALCVLRKDVER